MTEGQKMNLNKEKFEDIIKSAVPVGYSSYSQNFHLPLPQMPERTVLLAHNTYPDHFSFLVQTPDKAYHFIEFLEDEEDVEVWHLNFSNTAKELSVYVILEEQDLGLQDLTVEECVTYQLQITDPELSALTLTTEEDAERFPL